MEDHPIYTPAPDECPRCLKRGKDWNGSNPKCAFRSGRFSSDNWNCATAWGIRDLIEKLGKVVREIPGEKNGWRGVYPDAWMAGCEDQHFGAINVSKVLHANVDSDDRPEGDILCFSSYKYRGCIQALWIIDGHGPPHAPTLGECETVLTFYQYDELCAAEALETALHELNPAIRARREALFDAMRQASREDDLLDDIEQLERSKRILEGDYNKLHDELISAESDAREAVKTRDRVLARCERLETALREAHGVLLRPDSQHNIPAREVYAVQLDVIQMIIEKALPALAATDKEPTDGASAPLPPSPPRPARP